MNDNLIYSVDLRGVATLTLNRPEVHNAFDDNLIEALIFQLERIAESPGVSPTLNPVLGGKLALASNTAASRNLPHDWLSV